MASDETTKPWEVQPMLKPRISKVIVNINVGKSGEPLENASEVLKELTGQNPIKTQAKKTIREFGIRKGEPIACLVTLRKGKATEFLKKVLPVVDYKIAKSSFDTHGNFAFGIEEHIEIAGVKYDPDVGIFGMNVCVSLGRRGYRVKKRKRKKAKIGSKQLLTPEESIVYIKHALEVEVV